MQGTEAGFRGVGLVVTLAKCTQLRLACEWREVISHVVPLGLVGYLGPLYGVVVWCGGRLATYGACLGEGCTSGAGPLTSAQCTYANE